MTKNRYLYLDPLLFYINIYIYIYIYIYYIYIYIYNRNLNNEVKVSIVLIFTTIQKKDLKRTVRVTEQKTK